MINTRTLGLSDQLKDYQVSLVKNANLYANILIVVAFIYSVFLLFYSTSNVGLGLMFFIPSLFTYIFNYFKFTSLGRASFVLVGLAAIAVNHSYLAVNDNETIFYLLFLEFNMFILLWTLIDLQEKRLLYTTIFLSLAVFFSFFWLNQDLNLKHPIEAVYSLPVYIGMIALNLFILLAALYSIQKKYLRSEEELEGVKKELEEKLGEIKKQDEELEKTLSDISETNKEDNKRNWVSNGLATINNILRTVDDDIFRNILMGIIEYAKLLYGGIYEVEEDASGDKFLKLQASFGFEKQKSDNKKIDVNEGLLGSLYHEKKPIYLIEIPKSYSRIASGLGDAQPKSIMLAPMIYEGEVKGVIELASFNTMEEYEREFVIKIGNLLARFMESYQNEQQTKILLEKTQQQTEEMRAQEEEMRQNMEELQATQEELHRKEKEYIQKIKELEKMLSK